MLSRKHYRAIASELASIDMIASELTGPTVLLEVVKVLSRYFKSDNPRFDREVFEAACRYVDNG